MEDFKSVINVNGANLDAYTIDLFGKKLMIIKAPKGFLACGYINIEVVEKFGQSCAIVTGVKSYDDMLAAKVQLLTSAASNLGVSTNSTGLEALRKFL